MSCEELLAMEQNIDHLLAFTERDVKWRDIEFYWQGKRPRKRRSDDHNKRLSLKTETKVRVQGRFYEALDFHFYHCYRNTHPERRMAICEEIERKIVIDDVTLSRFRKPKFRRNMKHVGCVKTALHISVNFHFTEVLIKLKCWKGN